MQGEGQPSAGLFRIFAANGTKMVSINSVYNAVKDLANKDQKGFITPAMFTSFARTAQIKIYNKIFDEIFEDKKLRRANVDQSRFMSKVFVDKQDLLAFIEKATIPRSSGVFAVPSNFKSVISISARKPEKRAVHMLYDEDKVQHLLSSSLSVPTNEFPVALMGRDIEVFPSSVSSIDVRYYRYPESPMYNYYKALNSVGEEIELFSNNSKDFELPQKFEDELVFEIAKMAGVNIKEPVVVNQSNVETNAK